MRAVIEVARLHSILDFVDVGVQVALRHVKSAVVVRGVVQVIRFGLSFIGTLSQDV